MMASSAGNRQESSDEEPDYMSEDFLKQCTSSDIRPSLLHNRADKRKHDILKRQLEANKTKQDKQKEMLKTLEEGLKVPISEDNKGFKMLQKMGFKPGSSIGKQTDDPKRKGITVPIEIELRHGRGGLGKEQHELEKHQQRFGNPEEYRLRQQNAVLAREIILDLKKAQFACHSLDVESGKPQPLEKWYWPKLDPVKKKDLETERTNATATDSSEDEDGSCVPVPSKKQRIADGDADDDEYISSSDDEEEEDDIPNDEKLAVIKDYLRSQYFYCLWCATKFDNDADMQSSCPGDTKDDH